MGSHEALGFGVKVREPQVVWVVGPGREEDLWVVGCRSLVNLGARHRTGTGESLSAIHSQSQPGNSWQQ